MPELMLIEEAVERASERLLSVLTLVRLSFEAGEAEARQIAAWTDHIIDPVASCYFAEARRLLLRPAPNLGLALAALYLAARLEPECYSPTQAAVCQLLFEGSHEAAAAELAAAEDETCEAEPRRT